MRFAKAMGRYLVNECAAFKLQTGEGITPFTCLFTYLGKVKPEVKKYFGFFLSASSTQGLCWTDHFDNRVRQEGARKISAVANDPRNGYNKNIVYSRKEVPA